MIISELYEWFSFCADSMDSQNPMLQCERDFTQSMYVVPDESNSAKKQRYNEAVDLLETDLKEKGAAPG